MKRAEIILFTSLVFVLPTGISHAEKYPEPNPPTDIKLPDSQATPKESSEISRQFRTPDTEWVYHKTADNQHPNGMEQQQLWLVNNARANPQLKESGWQPSLTLM